MRVRDRSIGSRLALGLADSGMSSVGNLGVSIISARSTSLAQFGIFATTMLVLLLVTGAFRSAHGDVLVLKARTGPGSAALDGRSSTASVLRVSGALGLATAVGGGLTALLSDDGLRSAALSVAIAGTALPLLCLQDHLRWIEYARGANHRAFANTSLWTVASIGSLLAVRLLAGDGVPAFVCLMCWGYSTVPGIVYAVVRGRIPLVLERPAWLGGNRQLVRPLVVDFSLTQASAQGATLVVAALAGAVEMALIRKGQIWLGPMTVATIGLLAALQPILSQRAATKGASAAVRLAAGIGALVSVLMLVYGAVVLLLPTDVAELLTGPGWHESRPYVWPLAVQGAAGMMGGCLGLALRTTGLLGRQVRWRTVLGPASVVAVAVVTQFFGAMAGMWCLAGAGVATVLVWAALLVSADRERRQHAVDALERSPAQG